MRVVIATIALLLAGCGGPSATAIPTSTVELTGGPTLGFVAAACAGTTYARCVPNLTSAAGLFAGSTVAICEYDGGEGDIVTVDPGETAEGACSGGGLIAPSKVHGTVDIPKQ